MKLPLVNKFLYMTQPPSNTICSVDKGVESLRMGGVLSPNEGFCMMTKDFFTPKWKPTPWVCSHTCHSMSNGTLRVCLDPKDLNKAIICEHHKASILEEMIHKLAGSTTYCKLDTKMAFGASILHMKVQYSPYLTLT